MLPVFWDTLSTSNSQPRRKHNMKTFISIITTWMYVTSVMSIISKRRLCLSYRMESSRGDHSIFHKSVAPGEHWCMMKCIRHPNCWAFNYFQNGTCDLLPVLGDCDEPHSQAGSIFGHLSTCKGEMPMDLTRNWTLDACLTWTSHNKDLPCPEGVLMATDGKFCLSLAPYHGLYIPGWFKSPSFRLIGENQKTMKCPAGYVVEIAAGCNATWQSYTVGDPVPPNAPQISVWRDGTPLYVVEYRRPINGRYHFGYYLPTVQRVYIMAGSVLSPVHVRMMVLNWYALSRV